MKHIVIVGTLASILAGCGGVEMEEEVETISAVESEGCEGKAFAYCFDCIGIHCSIEECATAYHFWPGAQNNNRARCRQLVSNWAEPKACKGLPIIVYSYWFRTTSGSEGESSFLACEYD